MEFRGQPMVGVASVPGKATLPIVGSILTAKSKAAASVIDEHLPANLQTGEEVQVAVWALMDGVLCLM